MLDLKAEVEMQPILRVYSNVITHIIDHQLLNLSDLLCTLIPFRHIVLNFKAYVTVSHPKTIPSRAEPM